MKRGFSLIELLITISFIGVISAVISSVYVTGFKTFREELANSIAQSDAQTILDAIVLDVKNGMLIEPTYGTYTTGTETIIVRVPAVDSSQNILYEDGSMLYDRVIYYYLNNQIHKVIYASPGSVRYAKDGLDSALDKSILSLSFSYDPDPASATLVTVTITNEERVINKERAVTLTGQARLRNHI